MNRSSLWQISAPTSPEKEERVAALLETIFCEPPSVYANAEKKISLVSVYSERSARWISERARLLKVSGLKRIKIKRLRREDWAESWKKHFRPLEIGSALLVKPSWSKCQRRKGQAVVVLDPGLSFGTGQHPTTRFCLEQIAKRRHRHLSLLDIGTGSGILAIAAAKLGYASIEAFDHDPEAVRVAFANARKNRIAQQIHLRQRDLLKSGGLPRRKFDVICANLISNLLIEQRQRILSRLKPDGLLVLAGILKREFVEVQRAYERAGLKLASARGRKEWRSGAFVFQ